MVLELKPTERAAHESASAGSRPSVRRRARDDAAAPALEEGCARAPVQVGHGAGRHEVRGGARRERRRHAHLDQDALLARRRVGRVAVPEAHEAVQQIPQRRERPEVGGEAARRSVGDGRERLLAELPPEDSSRAAASRAHATAATHVA